MGDLEQSDPADDIEEHTVLDDASQAWLDATLAGDTTRADALAAVLDAATTLERQHRNQPDRIRNEALKLTAAGIPVFPIEAAGKRPLTRHGFKDATTDTTTITDWWTQWPDANLGLPTGIGFDVIDIDGHPGMVSMYGGPAPVIDTVTILGIATTSRDGGRHLYVPASGRGNKASVYPGIDYRGTGGYVVAPPSVGANGRRYEWIHTLAGLTASAAA